MTLILVVTVLVCTLCYLGLVLIENRRNGAFLAQMGSVVGAGVLFFAVTQGNNPGRALSPVLLPAGIGLLSVTTGAMGYHLFLGRFTSFWTPSAVFLAVSSGIAAALSAILMFLD